MRTNAVTKIAKQSNVIDELYFKIISLIKLRYLKFCILPEIYEIIFKIKYKFQFLTLRIKEFSLSLERHSHCSKYWVELYEYSLMCMHV